MLYAQWIRVAHGRRVAFPGVAPLEMGIKLKPNINSSARAGRLNAPRLNTLNY